ncbi:hypothetical protein ABK040_006001 [Willaertia magna]
MHFFSIIPITSFFRTLTENNNNNNILSTFLTSFDIHHNYHSIINNNQLLNIYNTSIDNNNSTTNESSILDHFPPIINIITFVIITIFFIICIFQTIQLNKRKFNKKKRNSVKLNLRKKLKIFFRNLFCCCYDSQSSFYFSWNLPLQFSLQYFIAFFISTIHSICLQYFFNETYLKTCFYYIDVITKVQKRTCPMVTFIDMFYSIIVKSTFLLLILFWVELVYNLFNFYNLKNCKYFERIIRRAYWTIVGLYLFIFCIGLSLFVIYKVNLYFFLLGFNLIYDILIPISFIYFGFKLKKLKSNNLSLNSVLLKHLNYISIFSLCLGFYLSFVPFIRITMVIIQQVIIKTAGPNMYSSIVTVISNILFFYLPSIVTFGLVITPTSMSFLHQRMLDRNSKRMQHLSSTLIEKEDEELGEIKKRFSERSIGEKRKSAIVVTSPTTITNNKAYLIYGDEMLGGSQYEIFDTLPEGNVVFDFNGVNNTNINNNTNTPYYQMEDNKDRE